MPIVGEPDLRGNFAEQVFSSRLAVTLGHELRKLPPLEFLLAYAKEERVLPLSNEITKIFQISQKYAPASIFALVSSGKERKSTNTVPIYITNNISTMNRRCALWEKLERRIARAHKCSGNKCQKTF